MSKKRRNHKPSFKAKVALAAIRGEQRISKIARLVSVNLMQRKNILELLSDKSPPPKRKTENLRQLGLINA